MLNIPEGATITVTNTSSRAFICGDSTILPHVPKVVDADLAKIISRSPYEPYFKFEFGTPQDTVTGGAGNDTVSGGQEPTA